MLFTKQERLVLISISLILFTGSVLNYALKRLSSFAGVIGFIESERIYRKVDINTAPASKLEQLPYVGPVVAKNIVSYREKNGNFLAIEQLKKVRGIGTNNFKKISPYIYVRKKENLR